MSIFSKKGWENLDILSEMGNLTSTSEEVEGHVVPKFQEVLVVDDEKAAVSLVVGPEGPPGPAGPVQAATTSLLGGVRLWRSAGTLDPLLAPVDASGNLVVRDLAATGNISGTNFSGSLSGTNTGDVTIGTASGLSVLGQVLSLALATGATPGALSATDKAAIDGLPTTYLGLTAGSITPAGGTFSVVGAVGYSSRIKSTTLTELDPPPSSATSLLDATGNGYTGLLGYPLFGYFARTQGKEGLCISILQTNANQQYWFSSTNNAIVRPAWNEAFTVSFWYYGVPANNASLSNAWATATTMGWEVANVANALQFQFFNGAGNGISASKATAGIAFAAANWNHICCTYNGSGLSAGMVMYVNGVALAGMTLTDSGVFNAGPTYTIVQAQHGHRDNNTFGQPAGAKVDMWGFWKLTALSGGQVASLYATPTRTGALALFPSVFYGFDASTLNLLDTSLTLTNPSGATLAWRHNSVEQGWVDKTGTVHVTTLTGTGTVYGAVFHDGNGNGEFMIGLQTNVSVVGHRGWIIGSPDLAGGTIENTSGNSGLILYSARNASMKLLEGSFDFNTILYGTGGGGNLKMVGKVVDGASAIATKLGNLTALSTAGAKITSFYSDNFVTEKAYIDIAGRAAVAAVVSNVVTNSPANGGSFTPDCTAGGNIILTAGAGVASFAVNVPTNPLTGQRLTFIVKNASGGVLTVTWNGVFLLAWTDPANTKNRSMDVVYDGTNWRQVGAVSPDLAN